MRLFERRYKATKEKKEQGRKIAKDHGLPKILNELPPGGHSYEKRFLIERVVGYKSVYDSLNTYKILARDKKGIEKECAKLGIIPVFQGDYITLASFPWRNIIKEEIIGEVFRDGVKAIEKKIYFDILHYIKL